MPRLTRWFVRSALVNMLVGMSLGVVLVARPYFDSPGWLSAAAPTYLHLITVGWLSQLIFGVGHWMFPKSSREFPRGDERLMWLVFGALNLGLVMRLIGEPLLGAGERTLAGPILAASAWLQWLAVAGFLLNTWDRVKER